MKPWEVLDRASAPDGTALTLVRHPSEFAILANGQSLMSSRTSASEEALAVLGCERARALVSPYVLLGGLGMGFTVRAALDTLPPDARILVAELVPAVVKWNRGVLGALARHPLDDPRVRIQTIDVGEVLRSSKATFDAILLDVDNGPAALTVASNTRLYDALGVAAIHAALRPGGVLGVWSAGIDRQFERRLSHTGFSVQRAQIRARTVGRRRHTIVLATVGQSVS
jgi:spermidine synthase